MVGRATFRRAMFRLLSTNIAATRERICPPEAGSWGAGRVADGRQGHVQEGDGQATAPEHRPDQREELSTRPAPPTRPVRAGAASWATGLARRRRARRGVARA